jgi:hypothetical protein
VRRLICWLFHERHYFRWTWSAPIKGRFRLYLVHWTRCRKCRETWCDLEAV